MKHTLQNKHAWSTPTHTHLALDGKLLIVEAEVILQLTVLGDDNRFAFGVVLWTPSTPHHLPTLKHILKQYILPPARI